MGEQILHHQGKRGVRYGIFGNTLNYGMREFEPFDGGQEKTGKNMGF